MSGTHTLVIGGGIVGLSTAYFLARRGEKVTVFEMDPLGEGASAGNAGIIAVAHPPLPRPGLMGKTLRLLFDPLGPVYVRPRLDPALMSWLWGFRRACRPTEYRRSLDVLCRIGREAGTCFRSLVEDERLECQYSPRGWLEVFSSEAGFAEGRREAARIREYGYEAREYSGADLREREPAFNSRVVGAVHYTDSAFADPARMVNGLATRIVDRGAVLRRQARVVEIVLESGRVAGVELAGGERIEGTRLVLAAGSWTTALARTVGIRIPMQPAKGYHLDLSGLEARPGTTCVLAERFVAVTPLGDGLRLAGTVELSGFNHEIVEARLRRLLTGARTLLRGLERARTVDTWCGLRPMTADGLPVVGKAPGPVGIWVATGHAMMGFMLGPLTGRLVSESILDGETSLDVTELGAGRFLGSR